MFPNTALHCEDTITKIWNNYSQKRNSARSLCPNFHIHVYVSDLYISTISLPILLQENMWTDHGNILIAHRHMNVEIGTDAGQVLFWEYINGISLQLTHFMLP